ncbi:MAG: hypothetical protein DIU72_010360 [Pseudomonadota bacterium]
MRGMRALASLLLWAWALPALAALDADLVLVHGHDPARLLSAYAAAARAPRKGSDAAARLPPVIAWAEGEEQWTQDLIDRIAPRKTVWIAPPDVPADTLRIPGRVQRIVASDDEIGLAIAEAAFSPSDRPSAVWVADERDPASAIAASALAAVHRSPLLVATGRLTEAVHAAATLAERLSADEVVVVGKADQGRLASQLGTKVRVLTHQDALRALRAKVRGTRRLVAVAPADARGPFSPPKLSLVAVPYVLAKGAALAYVGEGPGEGKTPEDVVHQLESQGEGPFDFITLIGDWLAIPLREVQDIDQVARGAENPRVHKIPPFVDLEGAPSDRYVGRLAALDAFDLSRWIARIVHGIEAKGVDGVLVFANAHDKFILGETISRTTSAELANAGVKVRSYYRDQITKELIERELPRHALVLWEGHPTDLTLGDDALPAPGRPLPPATVFLQGCYTLDRSDPFVLVERGANAVLGTYMAVYSSSGSAFARAYVNAQVHRGATAGEALASARNYLLTVVELKKRRGFSDWRKTLRAALSFDLWGDPEAPPPVQTRAPKKPAVAARLRGNRLTVTIPASPLPLAQAGPYEASVRPGGALAGLYDFVENEEGEVVGRRLSELFFVEVELPESFGDAPTISAPYPEQTYAWVFSPRTRTLSLLIHQDALPRPGAAAALQFTVIPTPPPVPSDG